MKERQRKANKGVRNRDPQRQWLRDLCGLDASRGELEGLLYSTERIADI